MKRNRIVAQKELDTTKDTDTPKGTKDTKDTLLMAIARTGTRGCNPASRGRA